MQTNVKQTDSSKIVRASCCCGGLVLQRDAKRNSFFKRKLSRMPPQNKFELVSVARNVFCKRVRSGMALQNPFEVACYRELVLPTNAKQNDSLESVRAKL